MQKETVRIKKLRPEAILPSYGSPDAVGADLYALTGAEGLTIAPGETVMVHTGLSIELPRGFAGLVYARSGLATKRGLAPANKVGVIDPDYRGEIMISLHNHGSAPATVWKQGARQATSSHTACSSVRPL